MNSEQKKDAADFKIFSTVFWYSFVIIVLPVSTFFGFKYFIFDGLLSLSIVASNVWSAVFAVIALHIALGMFIHRAYMGSSDDAAKPISKQD